MLYPIRPSDVKCVEHSTDGALAWVVLRGMLDAIDNIKLADQSLQGRTGVSV
jgi:hypothetical protein